jgi:creatinine amidohydrolase/Fe(II)-dependent formamide hydrolase-like protein
MFEAAMLGIAKALVAAGWKVIAGVTGHDVKPQRDAIRRAIEKATKGGEATGFAVMEGELHKPDDEISLSMDHAGAWETSCMMYAYPEKVNLEALSSRELSDDDDLQMSGPEGIGGRNPLKYASAEMGQKIIETMGRLIGARANCLLEKLVQREK